MRNSDSAFSKLSSVEGFLNSMYGRIDSVFNPENYYDGKYDVPIINGARQLYLSIFVNQPLPPYLRYKHESQEADKVLSAQPLPLKKGERYHPSQVLPKKYEIRAMPVGANAVSESCRNLIIEIHQYLNALNGAAVSWKAKAPLMHYGHHNDAIRSIFLMIIHVLSDLSTMDLTRSEAKIVAEKYIRFLGGLASDTEIRNALCLKSAVTIKRERGVLSTEVMPLQMVAYVNDEFKKIKDCVLYHASRASILEHAIALKEQLDLEIRNRFAYWVYVSSASSVEDAAIAISQRNIPVTQEGLPPLAELRVALSCNLSASISTFDQNQSTLNLSQLCVVYDSESRGWVSSLQTEYTLDGSQGGVYPSLANDADAMQTWLQYASVLEAMGRLRLGLDRLMQLLRVGGDVMAVLHFSQPIRLFLSTIETLLDDLLLCQKKLSDFVSQKQNKIFKKIKRTDSDNKWLENIDKSQRYIADSRSSLVGPISKIREQIIAWEENPLKKIQDFQKDQKDFFIIFENVSALIAPSDEKYAVIARNIRAIVNNSALLRLSTSNSDFRLSVQPQLVENDECVNSLSPKNELRNDDHQINSLEKIEELLVAYSERHGFRFNLPNIKLSLKYEDCVKIVLDISKYSSKRHQYRATKIYDWLGVILARNKSEKEKLMFLQRDILSLRKTPEYQENFKTGRNGLRIDGLIEQIYQWTLIRLSQLTQQQETPNIPAPHNQSIVRSEEIPMRTESTVGAKISTQVNQVKVIAILEKLIRAFENLKNPQDQSAFIKGWQILCHTKYGFLKRLTGMHATMREHHVKADEWRKLASGSEFFTQLADDTQTEKNKTISDLCVQIRNQLSLNANEVQGKKDMFAKKASQSEKALRDFEKQKWAIVDPEGGLPWNQAELSELRTFLNVTIGLSDMQGQYEFLHNISLLLLQRQSDISDVAQDELNKLLGTIFFEYQQAQQKLNLKEIIRGLLSLGANPLEWMINNPVSDSDTPNEIDLKNALVYYTVAQQIEFVLSHCQYRAKFLGESVVVLGQKLLNLMKCLQNFGLKLNECVETDNDLSWRVAQKVIPKSDGMRIHRAALFSAVLQFIYLSLNDKFLLNNLTNNELSLNGEIQINSLSAIEAEINELQNKYLNALKGKNRIYKRVYNVGHTAWMQLKNALVDVQGELLKLSNVRLAQSKIATEKKLMEQEEKTQAAYLRADASDARAEAADARAEQERREKETLLIQAVMGAIEDSREFEMLNERITSHFSGCRDTLSMRNKAISISSLFDEEITRAIEKLAQKLCARSPQLDKNDIEARISLLLKVNDCHKSIAFLLQHGRSEMTRDEFSSSAVSTSAVSSAGLFSRSANQAVASATSENQVLTVDQ